MKTLHLRLISSFSCLIALSAINTLAIPYMSPQDLYKQSDMVLHGQVISKQEGPSPDYYYYQIKVDTYFKNPQKSDSITVAGHKLDNKTYVSYPQFEVGDKAIFYIHKQEGVNTISPYSQKAGDACDVHSFLGPAPLPGEPLFTRGPPASNPRLTDINGNALGLILTNQEVVLSYDDIWNNYPEARMVPVEVSIKNEDSGQQVFHKTQNLEMQACSWAGTVKWNFVPTQIGNYVGTIAIDGKTKMTIGFKAIFESTVSIVQSIQSPLKQFKSGIAAKNVTCKAGLQLVLKSTTSSPLCVKEQTKIKLLEIGWAKKAITNTKTKSFGITALVVYHPHLGCLAYCGPNDFYLKINSNSTAYLLGYNICDGNSCVPNDTPSLLLPINKILAPDYAVVWLPADLKWKNGDTVVIQVKVASTPDNKNEFWIDLGESKIVP